MTGTRGMPPPPEVGAALRVLAAPGRALISLVPIMLWALGWETLAASGAVTPFHLPRLSAVLVRIRTDAVAGDLLLNPALTLYRALLGFAIAATAGILLGISMARNAAVRWLLDPIV